MEKSITEGTVVPCPAPKTVPRFVSAWNCKYILLSPPEQLDSLEPPPLKNGDKRPCSAATRPWAALCSSPHIGQALTVENILVGFPIHLKAIAGQSLEDSDYVPQWQITLKRLF